MSPKLCMPIPKPMHPLKDIFYSHILAIVLLQPREPNARFIDGTKSYYNEKIVQPNQLF